MAWLIWVGAYLLGSIAIGVLVARLLGKADPRTVGSGGIGATNILRYGGKGMALAVFVGDVGKGLLAVWCAQWLSTSSMVIAFAGFFVVLGHVFPCFFSFKGGKGVAAAAGVLWGLAWPLGLAATVVWLLVFACSRISSLSSLITVMAVPLFLMVAGEWGWLLPVSCMMVLVIWAHRDNIRRLLAKKEPKVKQ